MRIICFAVILTLIFIGGTSFVSASNTWVPDQVKIENSSSSLLSLSREGRLSKPTLVITQSLSVEETTVGSSFSVEITIQNVAVSAPAYDVNVDVKRLPVSAFTTIEPADFSIAKIRGNSTTYLVYLVVAEDAGNFTLQGVQVSYYDKARTESERTNYISVSNEIGFEVLSPAPPLYRFDILWFNVLGLSFLFLILLLGTRALLLVLTKEGGRTRS